jgi:intracellular septation protein A
MTVKGVVFGLSICFLLAYLLARQLHKLPSVTLFLVCFFGGIGIFGLIFYLGQNGKAKDEA